MGTKPWRAPIKGASDLIDVLLDFRMIMGGWWFTCGECSVSAHASVGPDCKGADADLLKIRLFDSGFDVDLAQPAQPAEALREAMREAFAAREAYRLGGIGGLKVWAKENGREVEDQANAPAAREGEGAEQDGGS